MAQLATESDSSMNTKEVPATSREWWEGMFGNEASVGFTDAFSTAEVSQKYQSGGALGIQSTSSVHSFPLDNLGSMSSLLRSVSGDGSNMLSAPKPTNPSSKLQQLKALMERKLSATIVLAERANVNVDGSLDAQSTSSVKSFELGNLGSLTSLMPPSFNGDGSISIHTAPVPDYDSRTILQVKAHMERQVPTEVPSNQAQKALVRNTTKKHLDYIEDEPNDNDVFCGRGGRSNHHPGNNRYLQAKVAIQPRYRQASKDDKTGISQELVDTVKSWGGRFLGLDKTTGLWFVVDDKAARKKASQALREDNTPESRAQKRAKYLAKLKARA